MAPETFGVYEFCGKKEEVLYVGKAKNIKKRISSYFNKTKKNKKTIALLKKTSRIRYTLVSNETDALLLENNLIKKYQPKYNILLKDSKSYPWICIKKEAFPRVFQTRKIIDDGSFYFGPFASTKTTKTLIRFLHKLYPLRTCSLNLSEEKVKKNKYSVCLEYHIGNCLGPCVQKQDEQNYLFAIDQIKNLLSGGVSVVIQNLTKKMLEHSKNLEYEEAKKIKDRLVSLEDYRSKSMIVSPKLDDVDVFSLVQKNKLSFVNYLKIINGSVVQSYNLEVRDVFCDSPEEILDRAIGFLRTRFKSKTKKVFSSHKIKNTFYNFLITTPVIGDKKKLIDLSVKNAKQALLERLFLKERSREKSASNSVLKTLSSDLFLKKPATHIECFDNSNIQGNFAVGSCVVFRNGVPAKNEYRHFNIKTVKGADDFKSMEEIVYRRYSRLLRLGESIPSLIVIDGGKGQLGSAVKSLKKLDLLEKTDVIGIAKKLEIIHKYGDAEPIYLNKRSASLKTIQKIRDEAHRFAIKHHRKKREKSLLKNSLELVKGIGKKTILKLLDHYGSLEKIKSAKQKDLERIIGKSRGKLLFEQINFKQL